jgi:hypothetical protein
MGTILASVEMRRLLCDAANGIADCERLEHCEYHIDTGLLPAEARAALPKTVVQHGVIANRKTLETAALHSFEQGLTYRVIGLEEAFAPSAMDM